MVTFAAIIVVSAAAGFVVGSATKRDEINQRFDPAQWNVYAMKTLEDKLVLTKEQQGKIQTIIDQTVEEMKALHSETVRKTSEMVDQLLSSIDQELTPEQRRIAETLSPSSDEVTIDLLKVETERE